MLLRSDIRERDTLIRMLTDESPSVRIAAAEVLASLGNTGDLDKALAGLLAAADCHQSVWFAAVEALNAIHRLGKKAALPPKACPC